LSDAFRIAVAGLGTVGAGLLRLIEQNGDVLSQRCGRPIIVTAVSARDRLRDRGVSIGNFRWFDDPVEMARNAEADIVVELIGGADGPAKAVCEAAIAAKRSIVTANKALIAHHGAELAIAAENVGVAIGYEAAVAGGIPIIKALREGLAGNRITGLYGIFNGTCNFILTTMRQTGREFAEVLAEAQQLGYAEADPGFDVDGVDAAHKLAILASVAFGCRVDFENVYTEGIRRITALDIELAETLGYRIKLLGIARRQGEMIEQRVHSCMVPLGSPVAHVEDVFNAVVVNGDFVGSTVYEGRGAGAGPTASAVIADIVDLARGGSTPVFNIPARNLVDRGTVPMDRHVGAYYIRLMVVDRPGVFADIAAILRDEAVSMEQILQRTRSPNEAVPLVMTTHEVEEAAMMRALEKFGALDTVVESPHVIRIEKFDE
jgi:homoserine dehydrogenase